MGNNLPINAIAWHAGASGIASEAFAREGLVDRSRTANVALVVMETHEPSTIFSLIEIPFSLGKLMIAFGPWQMVSHAMHIPTERQED